jgi:hypothetical protein
MENESAKLLITDIYNPEISALVSSVSVGNILNQPDLSGELSGTFFSNSILKVSLTGSLFGLSDYRSQWIIASGTETLSGRYSYGSVYGQTSPTDVTADDVIFNNNGIYSGSTLSKVINDLSLKISNKVEIDNTFADGDETWNIDFSNNTCNIYKNKINNDYPIYINLESDIENATCIFTIGDGFSGGFTFDYPIGSYINEEFDVSNNKPGMYIINVDGNIITWCYLHEAR